jgi:aminoglycoside phosphotransferase (APT) family kinase protein
MMSDSNLSETLISETAVEALAENIFGSTTLCSPIDDSYSTTVWRLTTQPPPDTDQHNPSIYYLRYHDTPVVYDDGTKLSELFQPEVWALGQVHEAGATVPQVIAWSDSCTDFPVPYIILTEIPGDPLINTISQLSLESREEILYQAGKDIAKVNAIPVKGFGYCNDARTVNNDMLTGNDDDWRAEVNRALERGLPYFFGKEYLSMEEADEIRQVMKEHCDDFAISQAFLAHADFDLSHIYQQNGSYTGIIDFGDKRCFDPVYDLAHFCMFYEEHSEPLIRGWKDHVRKNNLHPEIDLENLAQRIAFYVVVISLNNGKWDLEHNPKQKPSVYVEPIRRGLRMLTS